MVQDKQVKPICYKSYLGIPCQHPSYRLPWKPCLQRSVRWLSVTWRASNEYWVVNQPSHVQPRNDLLILDEIGECERAVTSLKYFCWKSTVLFCRCQRPNIGLLNTLPCGQGRTIQFTTTDLQEFIYASNEQALIKAFDSQASTPAVHTKLMDKLTDYFYWWYAGSRFCLVSV